VSLTGAELGIGPTRGLFERRGLLEAGGLIFGGREAGAFPAVDRFRLPGGLADDGADGTSAVCTWVFTGGGIVRDALLEEGLGFEEEGGGGGTVELSEAGGGIGTEGAGGTGGFAEAGAEDWGVSCFADLMSSSGLGSLFEECPRPPPRPTRPPLPLPRPGRLRPLNALPGSPDLPHLRLEAEGAPEGVAAGVAIEMLVLKLLDG